jgi:hypothetical protein
LLDAAENSPAQQVKGTAVVIGSGAGSPAADLIAGCVYDLLLSGLPDRKNPNGILPACRRLKSVFGFVGIT